MLPLIFYSFKELSTMLWERYFQLHGKGDLVKNAVKTFSQSMELTISGDVSIYYE